MTGSTDPGPMVAVRQFVEGFNNGDIDLAQAACTDETSIVDDFPPHEWAGPGATTRWYREMAAMATESGMSDWSVTLAEPRHITVSDRHAYVVIPADVRWQQDGASTGRTAALTVALREEAEGWRISAFTWTWD
jgi:hypothetical protein